MAEEKAVINTSHTHTHTVSAPSVFLQKQNDEDAPPTYFDQKVPVPEEDSEVIQESVRRVKYGKTFSESVIWQNEDINCDIK